MSDCPWWKKNDVSKLMAILLLFVHPTISINFPPVPDILIIHRTPAPASPVTIFSSKNSSYAPRRPSALNTTARPGKPTTNMTSNPTATPVEPTPLGRPEKQTLTPTVTQLPTFQRPEIDTPFTAAPTVSPPPTTGTVSFNPVPMSRPSPDVGIYSSSDTPQPVASSNSTITRNVAAGVSAGLVAVGLSALFLMCYFD